MAIFHSHIKLPEVIGDFYSYTFTMSGKKMEPGLCNQMICADGKSPEYMFLYSPVFSQNKVTHMYLNHTIQRLHMGSYGYVFSSQLGLHDLMISFQLWDSLSKSHQSHGSWHESTRSMVDITTICGPVIDMSSMYFMCGVQMSDNNGQCKCYMCSCFFLLCFPLS